MIVFLHGALSMASAVSALFFLRFYSETRDRLFGMFAASFAVLAVHWTVLGLLAKDDPHRPHSYLLRLLAFALILVGIIDKNRQTP